MDTFLQWWHNDLSKQVKFVFFVLLANALPAFTILILFPHKTENFFVWTIGTVINARLIAAMYGNAIILVAIGMFMTSWATVRINMVVITLFSILATLLTFAFLKPFLAHPWFHLTYWLVMYFILFFGAPYVFYTHERKEGGRLPVNMPINLATRAMAFIGMIVSLVCGLGLIFNIDAVNAMWPWHLAPLVGGLIGVLFLTHTAAYGWALWDGDWLRVRPMFWQAPLTGLLFIALPLLHSGDLRADAGNALLLYYVVAGLVTLSGIGVILSYRSAEREVLSHA